jgi:hypothetical protein
VGQRQDEEREIEVQRASGQGKAPRAATGSDWLGHAWGGSCLASVVPGALQTGGLARLGLRLHQRAHDVVELP